MTRRIILYGLFVLILVLSGCANTTNDRLEIVYEPESESITHEELDYASVAIANSFIAAGFKSAKPAIEDDKYIRILISPYSEDAANMAEEVGKDHVLRFIGPQNDVFLTEKDIVEAQGIEGDGGPIIGIKLSPEGRKKFAEATGKYSGQIIEVYLNEELISLPLIGGIVDQELVAITDIKGIDEANKIAKDINQGIAMPYIFKVKELINTNKK